MKNVLFLFVIVLVFIQCSPLTKQQKTENKVVKKMDKLKAKYPEAFEEATTVYVRIDTLIEEVQIEGELRIDTLEVENLVKEFIHDTVRVTEFITRFLEETRDSVAIDSLGIHLRLAGTNIDYDLKRDSLYIEKEQAVQTITITETNVIKKRFYQDWLFWLIVALATAVMIFRDVLVTAIKGIVKR